MTVQKIRVGVLCGGQSAEHEISILSAKNVMNALDKSVYQVALITIDKSGGWCRHSDTVLPESLAALSTVAPSDALRDLDVVFPVLHGPNGEDGTVQGFLKLLRIPYVGPDVLGSAICMDKDVTKRLLVEAGLPVTKHLLVQKSDPTAVTFQMAVETLGLPCFIKPANMGSSVGISCVDNEAAFSAGLKEALRFDHKVLIEEAIDGREIECSVLGSDHPEASLPGEIVTGKGFYSYSAKYLDDDVAELVVPAKLSSDMIQKIQALAVKVFQVLCCDGMARVDFFVCDELVYVNEVNTIPGFTNISMYPKLWEATGLSQTALMDRLIASAFERQKADDALSLANDFQDGRD